MAVAEEVRDGFWEHIEMVAREEGVHITVNVEV